LHNISQHDDNPGSPLHQTNATGMLWGEGNNNESKKIGGRLLVIGHTIQSPPMIELTMMTSRNFPDIGAICNRQPDWGKCSRLHH
jgi:hypothetical protein